MGPESASKLFWRNDALERHRRAGGRGAHALRWRRGHVGLETARCRWVEESPAGARVGRCEPGVCGDTPLIRERGSAQRGQIRQALWRPGGLPTVETGDARVLAKIGMNKASFRSGLIKDDKMM